MKAPFPWFGGKSKVAHLVWERFGDVPNYVEPFAGSLAVLLGRPTAARTETVNDLDCYLSNFWRSIQHAPAEVAHWADSPVNEADLHARHRWLVDQVGFRDRMHADPDFFDAKIAGWWAWGICQWIGSGWCVKPEWKGRGVAYRGRGLHRPMEMKRPILRRGGHGVHRKMPLIGELGAGRGVLDANTEIEEWFLLLQDRLRHVRVCCGDWRRVLGPSPTTNIGVTAVFLDPPYDMRVVSNANSGRDGAAPTDKLYSSHDNELSAKVMAWALEHGTEKKLRIALCGYEGEHNMPASWECVPWKANGGYGNQGHGTPGKENATRERIWFSPHCLCRSSVEPVQWLDSTELPESLKAEQITLLAAAQ